MAISIKNIKLTTKEIELCYPTIPEFKVKIGYLSNELTRKLLNQSNVVRIDEATGVSFEETDNEKFSKLFCKHAILGWEGLTIERLSSILLIDTEGQDLEAEVEFSEENAYDLYIGSTHFSKWVTTAAKSLTQFRTK